MAERITITNYELLHRMDPPGKRGGLKNNMTLSARFQKLREKPYYQGGLNTQSGREELNSQRGLDYPGLPSFSANVISMATLLLIIHIAMHILISLI